VLFFLHALLIFVAVQIVGKSTVISMPLCRSKLLNRFCCSGITAVLILRQIARAFNTIRIFYF